MAWLFVLLTGILLFGCAFVALLAAASHFEAEREIERLVTASDTPT